MDYLEKILKLIFNEGVIGTLLGTFIGYVLAKIGKIRFYLKKSNFEFLYKDEFGQYLPSNIDSSDSFNYKIEFQLHNSSGINKILRDIIIEFKCNDGSIITSSPIDSSSKKYSDAGVVFENLEFINVEPNKIIELYLDATIEKEYESKFDSLKDIKNIYFVAKTYHNRKFKKIIK